MKANIELVNFTSAYISHDGAEPELVVAGEVTSGGGTVSLEPHVYVSQPEYWSVDVLWDRTNAIFTAMSPFEVEIPVSAIKGRKGFRVIGRSVVKSFDLD
ncbi:hypothetical protein [Roseovarius sp. 2305UL8-3]|uniref:hypothetical protein n=1 Tax=Roseovarius conchicola TaxID=3121636 RepID=UPI003529B5E2